VVFATIACARSSSDDADTARVAEAPPATALLDTTRRVAVVTGFSGPEAVRYDPDQDVYFVGNFNGDGDVRDNNGFISRMSPDGAVDSLRFITGGRRGVTLHAPRGMWIAGDTLWVVDVDAVRGFDRRTGAPAATIDFGGHDAGFLNDVAAGGDGALYVTDTPRNRVYRIRGRTVEVALTDSALGGPNGITWDAARGTFIIVPYFRGQQILSWAPSGRTLEPIGASSGGSFDGVERMASGSFLVASQRDSSLHLFRDGVGQPYIRTGGQPADIAVDTRRMRVAAPFISRNAVEIWQLPNE
jgi:sugar lactone lactonase YvrE